ncbi:nidogen-like domain-containing protein [Uliginosibacterium sp. H1]|uniref:nidogen-like domain-containing protein n=1 Tax=Uliginosibacterium sp. H1 TaxID=3114757 RepID=UPI002E18FA34|nr:nidogen-like domain-containing protein [Uliginosibacterium sp. H1]
MHMKLGLTLSRLATALVAVVAIGAAQAAVTTVPQSALVASDYYYTDLIGGGIGNVVVTTGGGNAANVGQADGRNDDGFRFVNLGFNVNFFGNTYSSLYINTNGNVSFGNGISAYVPTGPTGANAPLISPFFGDVDTRNTASGVVHVRTDVANQIIVTWDNVGYYNLQGAPTNSFQLVLRGEDYGVPVGEGSIGFFYKDMGWERTATSTTAAVGFGDGQGNAKVLEGSNTAGLFPVLDNHHIWFDPNLNPVSQVPEPGALALLGIGLLAGIGARARKSA